MQSKITITKYYACSVSGKCLDRFSTADQLNYIRVFFYHQEGQITDHGSNDPVDCHGADLDLF